MTGYNALLLRRDSFILAGCSLQMHRSVLFITVRACPHSMRSRQVPSCPRVPYKSAETDCSSNAPTISAIILAQYEVKLEEDEWASLKVEVDEYNILMQTVIPLPMGLVIEENADRDIVIEEISEGGNAAQAYPEVCVGDRIRAVTAVIKTMVYPASNVMLGGIGRPALKRVLMPKTDAMTFQTCMDAMRSNSEADGVVTVVLERQGHPPQTPLAGCQTDEKPLFDPRIFE